MTTETAVAVAPTSRIEAGSILVSSWGYDQTNIDFYKVKKITENNGQRWVTIVPLKSQVTHYDSQAMAGTKMPSTVEDTATSLRRKLRAGCRDEGFSIHRGYGWCSLWDGKPQRYTTYG